MNIVVGQTFSYTYDEWVTKWNELSLSPVVWFSPATVEEGVRLDTEEVRFVGTSRPVGSPMGENEQFHFVKKDEVYG